jgi:hypothetical protein
MTASDNPDSRARGPCAAHMYSAFQCRAVMSTAIIMSRSGTDVSPRR